MLSAIARQASGARLVRLQRRRRRRRDRLVVECAKRCEVSEPEMLVLGLLSALQGKFVVNEGADTAGSVKPSVVPQLLP